MGHTSAFRRHGGPASGCFAKFDVSYVPADFLTGPDILYEVNAAISDLENSFLMHFDVDLVYDNRCDIVRKQMYSELPYIGIK